MSIDFKKIYPHTIKAGLEIKESKYGLHYVERESLMKFLKESGRWKAWCDWAMAITCVSEGIYPCDVEDFLAGRPNYD